MIMLQNLRGKINERQCIEYRMLQKKNAATAKRDKGFTGENESTRIKMDTKTQWTRMDMLEALEFCK